jgi:pectin methylesterase-like acyl-CoA thioesterase
MKYDFVVDAKGKGDFNTLQGALAAASEVEWRRKVRILVNAGLYKERLNVIDANRIELHSGPGRTTFVWDEPE